MERYIIHKHNIHNIQNNHNIHNMHIFRFNCEVERVRNNTTARLISFNENVTEQLNLLMLHCSVIK